MDIRIIGITKGFAGAEAALREVNLDIRNGELAGVVEAPGIFDEFAIEIAAGDDVWAKILAPVPPPFYHDLFPAQLHHGLRISGDLESVFAYYGALRRLTELMRAVHNDAAVAA